jgi:hypothetical protein
VATNPGVLKLETNIPQVIALQFSEGKEVDSQYTGTQVLFSLVDGRRWYVAPFVAEKIRAAGVAARMPFQVCKRQIGKSIEFEIETHNQTKAAGSSKAPAASNTQSLNQADRMPVLNPNTNTFEMPGQTPTPWPQYTPAQQAVIERKLPQPPQPEHIYAPAEPVSPPSMVNRILASYVVAFDVVAKLQQVSDERGLGLNWIHPDHIRPIAACAFIEANKAARS